MSGFPRKGSFRATQTEIASKIKSDLKRKYKDASDFNGAAWVPKKGSGQLLIDTGETYGSLTSASNTVSIAGKMIYHQDGTSKIPARPIIGVGKDQEDIAIKLVEERINELFN
jgi:phage gpG-like protein